MHLSVIGLLSAAALVSCENTNFSCTGDSSYRYPVEGSCHRYYSCTKGSVVPQNCLCPFSWFFRSFDPIKLSCEWCWKVDCSAKPAPPPTPAPTSAPTTAPTAKPTTAPTAKPTTTPTAKARAAPTAAPIVSPTSKPKQVENVGL